MTGPVGAVVLVALEAVPAGQGAGLLSSVGEELEALDTLTAGLGGACRCGRVGAPWMTAESCAPSWETSAGMRLRSTAGPSGRFTGLPAAPAFGPLPRFVAGTGSAA